ncbi:hypothetical protein [Thermodesulfatator autotrophicus]|uniref:MltA-interacting MipA family protein n=1 Tax=Thermodesulfatator autotrophicus TaxID=1795632 RepID=A0A177E425_9BACT|nr:hypothetical protein [Thermodesulfatator autotrophicus]OAG26714.1 hypothetical protein TH606_10865 [Thermodesulfatator autotrophicus]
MERVKGWLSGILLVCLLLLGATQVKAEETSADFSVDVLSQYIWRGMAFSDDSVVIQPSMTIASGPLSINFWANYDSDLKGADEAKWNETDFTIDYAFEGLPYGLSANVGSIYYALDGTQDSFELYAGLSGTCPVTGISLGLTVYKELSHYPGWWFELSAAKSFELPWQGASLDLGATALYLSSDDAGAYADPDDPTDEYSGWVNMNLSASISIPVTEKITVTPQVYYSFALGSDAKDMIKSASLDNKHDHFYGGVGISFAF